MEISYNFFCKIKFGIEASSSGRAACPGGQGVGVRGQPRGSGDDPKVIPRRFKRKNFFVTYARTHSWTDRRDGRNSGLDVVALTLS